MSPRAFRTAMIALPVLIGAGGIAYLLGTYEQPTTNRAEAKAATKAFYHIPGLGKNARVRGAGFEVKTSNGDILYTHGPDVLAGPSPKLDVPPPPRGHDKKSAPSGLSRLLSAATEDPYQEFNAPPFRPVVSIAPELVDGGQRSPGTSCASSGPRVEFVHLFPDGWDSKVDHAGVQRLVNNFADDMSATFSRYSYAHGGPPIARLRVGCSGGNVKMHRVPMPKRTGDAFEPPTGPPPGTTTTTTPGTTSSSDRWTRAQLTLEYQDATDTIQRAGIWEPGVRYVILWPAFPDGIAWGASPWDSSRTGGFNNSGAAFVSLGNTPTGGWISHELLHAMAATQSYMPNSTAGWHCTDGWDQLCRGDDDPGDSDVWTDTSCPSSAPQAIDCNGDDYFNPLPKPGSIISRHWNLANQGSNGGFLEFEGDNRCAWAGTIRMTLPMLGSLVAYPGKLECEEPAISSAVGAALGIDGARGATVNPGEAKRAPGVENVPVG